MGSFPSSRLVVAALLLACTACPPERKEPSKTDAAYAVPEQRVYEPSTPRERPLPLLPPPEPRPAPIVDPATVKLATDKFNSARACGACHQNIYDKWSRSMHANSFDDPVFRRALYEAHYNSQGTAAPLCLRCHAPTATATAPLDIYGVNPISREGVTCDYCHSISEVTQNKLGETSYRIDLTAKHGPYPETKSPAHKASFRPFFEKSEFCAGCHDYNLPDGTIVFATYSEWKASKYAEDGEQCQSCHMPRLTGGTVSAISAKGHPVFNDHNLVGGHSATQTKRALTVRVETLSRDANRVRAVVLMENTGAGHFVPTGIPSRRLVLAVSARQRGQSVFHQEIVYQRVMQGESDRPLTEAWEIKLRSKRVLRDNRIAPKEARHEAFVFNASAMEDVELSVRVAYQDPAGGSSEFREIVIAEVEQILPRGR